MTLLVNIKQLRNWWSVTQPPPPALHPIHLQFPVQNNATTTFPLVSEFFLYRRGPVSHTTFQ
jgi:hypothetical protein